MLKALSFFCLAALALSSSLADPDPHNRQQVRRTNMFNTNNKSFNRNPLQYSMANLFLPMFAGAAAVASQFWADIFIPPVVKNVVCKALNFANYAGCCTAPGIPNFASSSAINACVTTTKSKTFFKIFTTYYLNIFMNLKNQLNFNDPTVVATFGPQACYAECVFRQQGWLFSNGSINYDVFRANVTSVSADSWDPVLVQIVSNCSTYVESKIGNITINGKTCSAKPAVLVQCIRKSIYASCPGASMVNTTGCVGLRRNIQNCDVFQMGSFSRVFG